MKWNNKDGNNARDDGWTHMESTQQPRQTAEHDRPQQIEPEAIATIFKQTDERGGVEWTSHVLSATSALEKISLQLLRTSSRKHVTVKMATVATTTHAAPATIHRTMSSGSRAGFHRKISAIDVSQDKNTIIPTKWSLMILKS